MAAPVVRRGDERHFLVCGEIGRRRPKYPVRRGVIGAEQLELPRSRGARHHKRNLSHAVAPADLGANFPAAGKLLAVRFPRRETEAGAGGRSDQRDLQRRARLRQSGGRAPHGELKRGQRHAHRAGAVSRQAFRARLIRGAGVEDSLKGGASRLAGGHRRGQRDGARVVERHEIFHPLAALDAGEGKQPGLTRKPRDHRAGAQRHVLSTQGAEAGEKPEEGVLLVEFVVGAGAGRRQERGILVLRRLGREHVFPRMGVAPPAADHALLVAIIDHGLAAGQIEQAVAELDEGGELFGRGAGVVLLQEIPEPATVVIAQKGGRQMDVAVVVGIVVVAGDEFSQRGGGAALGNKFPRGAKKSEVEGGIHRHRVRGKLAEQVRAVVLVVHLAKLEKIRPPAGPGLGPDGGTEGLPEGRVHVLDRVDPVAVDAAVEPVGENIDEALDHPRVLGEEVVEPGKVTQGGALPCPGAVAAVVVKGDIVQPRGVSGGFLRGCHHGYMRETPFGGQRGKRGGIIQAVVSQGPLIEGLALDITIGRSRPIAVIVLQVLVGDHIRRVIDDDVHVDLQAAGMRLLDELAKFLVGPEVGIDLQEIRDPVTVIARTINLHRLVFKGRGHPHGRDPQLLQIVQLGGQAGEVAAVVVVDAGGVEAAARGAAGQAAGVVGGGAIGKPVGQHEVHRLAGAGMGEARDRHRRHGLGEGGSSDGQRDEPANQAAIRGKRIHGVRHGGRGRGRGQTGGPREVFAGGEKS